MSQESVEVVRAYVEAYNAGGETFADFLGDFMAEDIEIVPDASRCPGQSRFAVERSIGATSPISTRIGKEAAGRKSGRSSPWETTAWLLGPTGEAGAGPAVSTFAPA